MLVNYFLQQKYLARILQDRNDQLSCDKIQILMYTLICVKMLKFPPANTFLL